MSTQNITISIPDPLYQSLKIRAEQSQRSVEEETLEVLATAMPECATLSEGLKSAVASLHTLDESALLRAARHTLPKEISSELEALNHKKQRHGLSDVDAARLADLVGQYERNMLLRAQAAVLLKQRGFDISELFSS